LLDTTIVYSNYSTKMELMPNQPSIEVKAWRELMHVHAAVTAAIDESVRREVGIPGTWYEALVEIAFAGGTMRMNEFACETTLTKSGATRFVDRLEEAGLVERTSCPTDRRVWQLSLTDEGRRAQRESDPHVLAAIHEHFGRHLEDDEARTIFDALRRMRPVAAEAAVPA
jgi:DNA-binding MarR family transcriptional regulator